MNISDRARLSFQITKIFLFQRNTPLFATMILTDRCNLSCSHCVLHHNLEADEPRYTFEQIVFDMKKLYKRGVRILCLSGGEIALWETKEHTISEIVAQAKKIGFVYVALATNGTIDIDYGKADFILISVDGSPEIHDSIRGTSYQKIIENIRKNPSDNKFIFMEINQINKNEIRSVCELARDEANIKAVSFNFHTPFAGTADLALSREEKKDCCIQLCQLMKDGYPVLNLKSCFPYIVENNFKKPCRQLMVMDKGEEIICNRCVKEKGLCGNCGYFETAEVSMIFKGNVKVWLDAVRVYGRLL